MVDMFYEVQKETRIKGVPQAGSEGHNGLHVANNDHNGKDLGEALSLMALIMVCKKPNGKNGLQDIQFL